MLNEDSLERELSCGICFELYDVPLQLPCMHTFCKGCLKDIIACSKNKKLRCPDCRRNVELGKSGIESLKRNFKLASIVEIYRQALVKPSIENEASKKAEAAVRSPSPVEKDYEFLSRIIQRSQENGNSPFEPHIIDDLWGTFKRTSRKVPKSRPPAPLPPRPQPVGTSTPPSVRPLPPIPEPRDFYHRPLPPSPPSEEAEGPFLEHRLSALDTPLEASAPAYYTLETNNAQRHVNHEPDQPDDDWVDMSSLVHQPPGPAPPIPPLPPKRVMSSPGVRDANANRPPIPVPRSNVTSAPCVPKRNSGDGRSRGDSMDSLANRPPLPLPRVKKS